MNRNAASILQINLLILSLTGVLLGFAHINRVSGEPWNLLRVVIVIVLIVASIILGEVISSVFHEIGHLIGGLLSGYSFVYFGCFGFVWMRENGKLVKKHSNTKGMRGASLLSPPEMKDGTFPFRLFYFSGPFMNLVLAGICTLLFFQCASHFTSFAKAFLVIGLKGLMDFIMNLTPFNIDGVLNDGYLLFNLGKEKNADLRLKYWRNLRIQSFITQGHRPKNIPEAYYEWANIGKTIDDPFVLEGGLIKYKHLMDNKEFHKAKECLETILRHLGPTLIQNQPLLHLELMFHELIGECRESKIKALDTKEVAEYVKGSALNESTQRVSYAYSRLFSKDNAQANRHLELFLMACDNSVNLGSIPGEKELIQVVNQIADGKY